MEDVRKLKNFEHESNLVFKKIDSTLNEHKMKNDIFQIEHDKIKKKQEEIQTEHSNAMEQLEDKTKKVEKIYKDMQKILSDFKKEYRYGFKKIIKAEVDIGDLSTQLRFVRNKLLPRSQRKQLNKEDLIREIDEKFEILYDQVSTMAVDQANFNLKIQNDQNKLQEPLEIEMSRIRQESNLMMRELERTQQANRELMNNVTSGQNSERISPKDNRSFINPSTAVSSVKRNRRHNRSMHEDITKTSKDQIRNSTPSMNSIPLNRLKRFNFDRLNESHENVPDYSFLIKKQLKQRKKRKTGPSDISSPLGNSSELADFFKSIHKDSC